MDIDECDSSPCQHGGACTESSDDPFVSANSYHCECTDDWSTAAETDCSDCHIGRHFTSGRRYVGGCKDCLPGTFSALPGAVFCTDCAAGKFVATPGADSSMLCQNCIVGQFSYSGAGNCTRCPAGQYQGVEGMQSCSRCEPGSTTDTLATPGATTCTQCIAGQFSAVATVECATCLPGSITDTLSRAGATTCTECRAGQYSELSISPCQHCLAGSFSQAGSTDCTACGRPRCRFFPWTTTAQGQNRSDVAFACSDEQWVASQDQSSCDDCAAGKEASIDRSHCQPCQPGTASEEGQSCLMCNDTRVNRNQSSISNSAQTACVPCGPGVEANAAASQCVDCPAAKFAPCTASGCHDCAAPLIVTPDRTACVTAYRCPAAQSCVRPCLTIRDCQSCSTGSVSAGGEQW